MFACRSGVVLGKGKMWDWHPPNTRIWDEFHDFPKFPKNPPRRRFAPPRTKVYTTCNGFCMHFTPQSLGFLWNLMKSGGSRASRSMDLSLRQPAGIHTPLPPPHQNVPNVPDILTGRNVQNTMNMMNVVDVPNDLNIPNTPNMISPIHVQVCTSSRA